MKREINEIFEYLGKKYTVIEADDKYPYKCIKCGFYNRAEGECCGLRGVTGDCRIRWRGDRKEVIFKEL